MSGATLSLGFGAGALFGSALLLSGVYSPAVITSQLRLSDFHMLQAFLAASAASAVAVAIADRSGWSATQIREPRALRALPSYSANVAGGLALGISMALTGACPGTVLVQAAVGVPGARWIAAGGLLGGAVFRAFRSQILGAGRTPPPPPQQQQQKAPERRTGGDADRNTVHAKLGVSVTKALLVYEIMCLAMIEASMRFAPVTGSASYLPPAVGGLFIGLAQAVTLLVTRRTVGVSGAYGDIAGWLLDLFRGKSARLLTPSVVFAVGIVAGSEALSRRPDIAAYTPANLKGNEPVTAFVGGILSIFGASLAGGCTSGHGISGMATLSTASFITVAAMFGGGIVAALVLPSTA